MPKHRVLSTRTRGVEVAVRAESSASANLLRQDDVPRHLQPIKEHYEVALAADEVQKIKRVKAQHTIGVMADATTEVTLHVNDGATEAAEILTAQPMRTSQRARAMEAIDAITDIANRALQDGLEEGAIRVNEIADSDPRAHQLVDPSIVIDDLTPKERLVGKVRRKR